MPTLFTLGCEGLSPEILESRLADAGASTLADVRAAPAAGGPGLRPERLAERVEGAGVGYVRLEGLARGGPDAAEDYAVLRGLALDEDVCLLGDGGEQALAERLAEEAGVPLVSLQPE